MRLPRYLWVLLALTLLACAYALWGGADITSESPPVARPTHHVAPPAAPQTGEAASTTDAAAVPSPVRIPSSALVPSIDLFPIQGRARLTQADLQDAESVPLPPSAPPLPARLLGAWWAAGDRVLIIGFNNETLLVCRACRTPGALRPGASVTASYGLEAVEDRRIVFNYVPLQIKQTLPLDETARKPGW